MSLKLRMGAISTKKTEDGSSVSQYLSLKLRMGNLSYKICHKNSERVICLTISVPKTEDG
jgi:hypothetical protein